MSAALWGLALASAFFFGLALVLTQFALRTIPAIQGAAISIPVSAVACWAILPFVADWGAWDSGAAMLFAAVGLFFPATVTILTFEANRRLGPAVAGAVGNLAPLWAVLIAVGLLGERLSAFMAVGVAAIVAGVTLIGFGRGTGASASWPLWVLGLPLLAAVIRGAVQPAIKVGLAMWNSPLVAVGIGYAVSAVAVLTVAGMRGGLGLNASNRTGVAWFAAVGLCNIAAVFTLYAALARGPVSLVSPVVASYPMVTLFLSWFLLRGTQPHWRIVLGIVATVAGIVLLVAVG
jgi:drug/metabolite transporter (DMT)-like permease